jgi:hypothetical protein
MPGYLVIMVELISDEDLIHYDSINADQEKNAFFAAK